MFTRRKCFLGAIAIFSASTQMLTTPVLAQTASLSYCDALVEQYDYLKAPGSTGRGDGAAQINGDLGKSACAGGGSTKGSTC